MGLRLNWIEALLPKSVLDAQAVVDVDPASRALVYKIDSPSGKSYIGFTSDLNQRLWSHRRNKSYIGNSLRKYTLPKHVIAVLAVLPKEEAFELEARAIEAYGTLSPDGMNLDIGGYGCRGQSAESRAKMSAALKGKKRTPEHCRALSEARKGRKMSDEAKASMSRAQLGRKHSSETLEKLRMVQSARWSDPKSRTKASDSAKRSWVGRDDRRAKVGESTRNRVVSDETREKMRESSRLRWAKPEERQKAIDKANKRWEDLEQRELMSKKTRAFHNNRGLQEAA